MASNLEILKNNDIFRNADEEMLNFFLENSETRNFAQDDMIYVEMSKGNELFCVLEGEIAAGIALANADTQVEMGSGGPGQIIGLEVLLGDGTKTISVKCKTDVKVLVWKAAFWQKVCDENPERGYRLMQLMSKELYRRAIELLKRIMDNVSWGLS